MPLRQDEDVLDTWFSSALWPFSTLGWPDRTPELGTFYPTNVLVTGFDIIFFWVARMIMMGLKFMGEVPFREVYVHGLVRDADGQKMSKSKGNILDPLDLIDGIDLPTLVSKRTSGLMRPQDAPRIEKSTRREYPEGIAAYGTDALRFTFAALASPGRNINFDVGRIAGYRNFCNKIWNAARFVFMNCGDATTAIPAGEPGTAERWIGARLAQTLERVHAGVGEYRFDLAAQAIHEFIWDEYCDWYLEFSKATLGDDAAPASLRHGTLHTLVHVLETTLRMAHPFMPFITEELWQRIAPLAGRDGPTIMQQPYPRAADYGQDAAALAEIAFVKSVILGVRRIRAERDIDPKKPVPVLYLGGTPEQHAWIGTNAARIATVGRVESLAATDREPDDAAVTVVGDLTLLVPLADLIDLRTELRKLDKTLADLDREHSRLARELDNPKFVERAPAEVVEAKRRRLADTESMLATYREQQSRYRSLLN